MEKKFLALVLMTLFIGSLGMFLGYATLNLGGARAKDTKILLWEDFETKRNLNNVWSFVTTPGDNIPGVYAPGGSWTVIDDGTGTGNRVLEAKCLENRGTAAFAGDTRWKDYAIEARIRTTDTYMGLILYADLTGKTYYSCYLGQNSPYALVEIWKHNDGIWGRNAQLLWDNTKPPYVIAGEWVVLKVQITTTPSGTLLEVFFKTEAANQQYPTQPQYTVLDTDSPYTSGRPGLIFYDDGNWGSTYELFDNVIVTTSK